MSTEISLVFPHQLYRQNPCISAKRKVVFAEDHLYFSQYTFHKQKLILHRASMRFYADYLKAQGFSVEYVAFHEHTGLESLFEKFGRQKIKTVHVVATSDYLLERRLNRYARKFQIELKRYASPNFLTPKDELKELLGTDRKYRMANFYVKQRKRLNILVDNENPVGGKWSFDAENRKKMPRGVRVPAVFIPAENKYAVEAREYVAQHFAQNPGSAERFVYPVTFEDAEKVLEDFLENRMQQFGEYEDAIVRDASFLFHSILTPALNIGLLSPAQVVEQTLKFHQKYNYPLNSLEGFIRQIIGWREFMRGIYELEGVYERKGNFWGFERKIPACFYTGTTGIEPIDATIRKIQKNAYCHHIERLMVLGSFMLLCEFHPDEVYRWFMELFIDAYDWVMVPNVYGMSQYADGGLITTKPYLCSSNYILKMSDYKKGNWCTVWDGLFWRFIHINREVFSKNQRMSMMVRQLAKMPSGKLNAHIANAEHFLKGLEN